MEGISRLLKKLSVEDVEKLKVLMSLTPAAEINKSNDTIKEAVTLRVFVTEYYSEPQKLDNNLRWKNLKFK